MGQSTRRRHFSASFSALALGLILLSAGPVRADAPGWESTPHYFAQEVGSVVTFAHDRIDLTPEARAILDRQITWLSAHPNYWITLLARVEQNKSAKYSMAMTSRLAQSVKTYLVSRGLPAQRIDISALGKVPVGATSFSDAIKLRAGEGSVETLLTLTPPAGTSDGDFQREQEPR